MGVSGGPAWALDCKLSSRAPGLGRPVACGISRTRDQTFIPALTGAVFTTGPPGSALVEL